MTPPQRLASLEKRLGTPFRSPALLEQSLTHGSTDPDSAAARHNERMEFLGDAVLGLVISEYLYAAYPALPEGELARMKSVLVSADALAQLARRLKLGPYLRLGQSEEAAGARKRQNLLADSLEALIGALYLDQGIEAARDCILRWFGPDMGVAALAHQDYKTLLQELTQKQFRSRPDYQIMEEQGPPHQRTFVVQVACGGKVMGKGKGASKKDAEQKAAAQAYRKFSKKAEAGAR